MARTNNILCFLTFVGLLVALQISSIYADSNVHIRSKSNLLSTSNTLTWMPISKYEDSSDEIVTGGFQTERDLSVPNSGNSAYVEKKRALYICRVADKGIYLGGQQIEGEKKCTVAHPEINTYDNYDLLRNVNNGSRLHWVAWDKRHLIPPGTVAVGDVFIARYVVNETENKGKNPTYTHFIGTHGADNDFGRITYIEPDGTKKISESGQVLVETEPIFYELNNVRLNHKRTRIEKRSPRVLSRSSMSNHELDYLRFATALPYTFNHSISWEHDQAMIKSLNTSITLEKEGHIGYISWGAKNRTEQSGEIAVEFYLQPGTAVNVTLGANYVEMEVPYRAELVSVYEDNERMRRMIQGKRREETMVDLKCEFGPVYYLSNMSLVPTTPPPPTTEAMLPTTTPARTMTTEKPTLQPGNTSVQQETNAPNEQEPGVDENLIVPPPNSNTSGMQNNDGGPLSLKNKDEGVKSSSTCLTISKSSLALIALSVIAYYRIT